MSKTQYTFSKCLNVNFKKTLDFECSNTLDFKENKFNLITINGNGSRIYSKFDDSVDFVFSRISEGNSLSVSNLTIAGFNHGIVNHKGTCLCNYVTFDNNKMDYWIAKDYGAGIYNEGLCICNNCTFSYNYCKYGAGIYSTGSLFLNNNTFIANCAYKEGSNVAVNEGTVYVDGEKIEENTQDITHVSPFNYDTLFKWAFGIGLGFIGAAVLIMVYQPYYIHAAVFCFVLGLFISVPAAFLVDYRIKPI